MNARHADKRNIEFIFNCKWGPKSTVIKEKKRLKNNGIKINPRGIRILNVSSKVKEFVIQWMPLK